MAFQGSLNKLPLPDIIQLVSVSGKTGVFTLKNGTEAGYIYLQDGQIVHAQVGDLMGGDIVEHEGRGQHQPPVVIDIAR